MEQEFLDVLAQRAAESTSTVPDDPEPSLASTFEPIFVESKLKAVCSNIKDSTRKLGAALSMADKPVKSSLRFAGTKVQETLRSPNFVVLHLKTKCNIAEVLSKRELKWSAIHAGYQVMDWLSLFDKLPFLKLSDWEMTVEPLSCIFRIKQLTV